MHPGPPEKTDDKLCLVVSLRTLAFRTDISSLKLSDTQNSGVYKERGQDKEAEIWEPIAPALVFEL